MIYHFSDQLDLLLAKLAAAAAATIVVDDKLDS